ncbi:MAG: hypothetical protein P8J55_03635 [Pseudomonadales bacterium]|nr:hypothetical protein [Pseudomonadales bacterium]
MDIVAPENDTAVRNNAGILTLTVKVEPRVQSHHTLTLLMDGQPYQKLTGTGTIVLENVDRGTHVFQLQVTHEQSGKVIETGPASSVILLRHSVQH